MKWMVLSCVTLLGACATPPVDNPSAPGAGRPGVDQRREARALELAEADCATQGKHAVARRAEGETFYDCVE
jgi:hypothetical protein